MTEGTISPGLMPPALPQLGFVKAGRQRREGDPGYRAGAKGKQPMKLPYFRITTRVRGDDDNYERDQEIHAKVGEKPVALDVRLPFDRRADNFRARMVEYRGQTLVRQCDGERVRTFQTEVLDPCARIAKGHCKCKPWGRLAVQLEAGTTYGGVHVYQTTSWEGVKSLQSGLDLLEKDFGSLRGLPLSLQLYPAEVQYQDAKGNAHTSTAYKAAIVLRASWEEARDQALQWHEDNRIARSTILQIAAGTNQALDQSEVQDAEVIVGEFFPGRVDEGRTEAQEKLGGLNEMIREIETLVGEVEELLEKALQEGKVADASKGRIEEAIKERDLEKLRTAKHWIESKLDPSPDGELPLGDSPSSPPSAQARGQ